MKKWVGLVIAALLIVGGIYLGSPYLAARNLKQAAMSGDADQLDASVDFPAVRESLKSQISVMMTQKMNNDPELRDNPFAGLAVMLVPTLVDRVVDTYVSSDGIAALVRGQTPDERQDLAPEENPDLEYDYEWVSTDRFRVKIANTKTQEPGPSLLFDRRGFASWKLIKLELPEELFEDE